MGVWRGNKRSTEVRGTPLGWGGRRFRMLLRKLDLEEEILFYVVYGRIEMSQFFQNLAGE